MKFKWIAVEDELPKKNKEVFCACTPRLGNPTWAVGWLCEMYGWVYGNNLKLYYITHWAYPPERPKDNS